MSLDICKTCDCIVDTDNDPDCYYTQTDAGVLIENPCKCEQCRENDDSA